MTDRETMEDKRIDAYIAKSQPFARPILTHLRGLIHRTCPEVTETIKWGFPNFVYGDGILCSMASFKEHCALNFWKAKLMKDPILMLTARGESAMGHFGRITSVDDLPPDHVLVSYLREAMKLNEKALKVPKPPKPKGERTLTVPPYFLKAVKRNAKAFETFSAFPYSHKKEYVQWVDEAKTEETREKRLATTIEWLTEGKSRNWKYERKKK